MGAPDSGRADPHIERTRRSPEINQAGIGEADQDDGCKCQKRRRHLSAALWQGKKASNPRPTVLEREPNLFLLGLLKSLIFLCSMN